MPSRNHGVGIERNGFDPLIYQPLGQVRVIGRSLATDPDIFSGRAAGSDSPLEQYLHSRVPLVETLCDEPRVPVQPERELGQIVGSDRESVEVFEEGLGQ